jgi:DNA replication and repair protein RecF
MSLLQLNVHSFRNISEVKLSLNPLFNVFSGINGSGKTSLMEAIYILSAGYSFKTKETAPLVQYGETHLSVFARRTHDETISVRKTISGPTEVNLNGNVCPNNSILARSFPCQVFYQDLFQIIDAGPSVRRGLMDWGVFHVKHEYHVLWRNYQKVLKQRNALLRQHPTRKEIVPWDIQIIQLADSLDQLRQAYFDEWRTAFQFYLSQLSDIECHLEYYRGWRARSNSLAEILEEQFIADCQREYTQSGPHNADIRIETLNSTAKRVMSRGQQKIILIALKLAQGSLVEKNCTYLFDDLTSELDSEHIRQLLRCLNGVKGQKIISVLDIELLGGFLKEMSIGCFNLKKGSLLEN